MPLRGSAGGGGGLGRMFGLEFDAVNENVAQTLEQYGTESRKISADVYIDDKACWPWMTKQEWERYLAG